MNTKEAIERVRSRFNRWALDSEDLAALQALGLVDAENEEDERIRNELYCIVRDNREVGKLLGVKNISCNQALAYLEKQKDASKAIEVVDRIDKYIKYTRAHTANARDMDDSNPNKGYYSGVDDTLSNIAGILNGVYSEGKQKEQKPTEKPDLVAELRHHLATTPKEQLEKEWDDLKEWCNVGPTVQEFLYGKPAEWSEEDKEKLEKCISHMVNIIPVLGKQGLEDMSFEKHIDEELVIWLKALPERFNLQPKEEWGEEDEEMFFFINELLENKGRNYFTILVYGAVQNWLKNRFKSLRPKKNISYGELPLVSIDYMEGLDTDFEKQVGAMIASAMNREHQFTSKYIKWAAQRLMDCVKDKQNSEEKYVSGNQEWSEEDTKFLRWLRDRLIYVYKEDPDTDFVHKFERLIETIPYLSETTPLTWEDMRRVDMVLEKMVDDDIVGNLPEDMDDKEYYTEVLRRYEEGL